MRLVSNCRIDDTKVGHSTISITKIRCTTTVALQNVIMSENGMESFVRKHIAGRENSFHILEYKFKRIDFGDQLRADSVIELCLHLVTAVKGLKFPTYLSVIDTRPLY